MRHPRTCRPTRTRRRRRPAPSSRRTAWSLFEPAPFESANAVGLLTTKADELGVTTISDLEGKSQDLILFGSPECRQRVDCLVGLEDGYGLQFKQFTPVDIEQRYAVLDDGQADLSIVFTLDGAARGTRTST